MQLWIKVCGIKSIEDAKLVEKLGFNAIGLNFYPGSKRYIPPEEAKKISKATRIKKVGIFVNENPGKVVEIYREVNLDLIQLHGDEPAEYIKKLPPQTVIKALHADENLQKRIEEYINLPLFAILVDTPSKSYGGSGRRFEWEKFSFLAKLDFPIIIAGGLNPDNFCEAVRIFKPFGLDFNSGVEMEPGKKDPVKLREISTKIKEGACSD